MSNHQIVQVSVSGPWPFITLREFQHGGRHQTWHARAHRKGLRGPFAGDWPPLRAMAFSPDVLNWWIGILFAIGSVIFGVGAVLSLSPALVQTAGMSAMEVNAVYFVGSIFFTSAAYLQLFQAANAGDPGPYPARRRHVSALGWRPTDIGWLSSFLQFLGTLLFNVSTFAAVAAPTAWLWQDLSVWVPNFAGSVLFLASGYLAFMEGTHRHWCWRPRDLTWWIVFSNLLGCIAFMISAVFAYVPAGGASPTATELALVFTLLGAIGFLSGGLLLLPEGTSETAAPARQRLARSS